MFAYTGPSQLRTGDTLWRDGHTAVVYDGYVCEAYISENGTIYGERGDTANETRVTPIDQYPLWKMTHIIRFPDTGGANSEEAELMAARDDILGAINHVMNVLRADLGAEREDLGKTKTAVGRLEQEVAELKRQVDNVNKGLAYMNATYLDPTKQAVGRLERKDK